MVTTVRQPVQTTPTDITPAGLSSLVSSAFITSVTKDNTVNQPSDLLVELAVTAGSTPSGNNQVILYIQTALDGANWTTGTTTGTDASNEVQLKLVGSVILTNTTIQRQHFTIASLFGGVLPPYVRFVMKNDCGVTLSSGQLRVSEVSNTAA